MPNYILGTTANLAEVADKRLVTDAHKTILNSTTLSTAGTPPTLGSVLIAGASGVLSQDNANFFYDTTNHRLALLNTGPTTTLSIGATEQFKVTSAGAVTSASEVTGALTCTQITGPAAKLLVSATAPTISGMGTGQSVTSSNGTAVFTIGTGTSNAASTATITFPAATNGWVVYAQNVTVPASNVIGQTGGSTTTATITNYARTTGLAANWTDSHVIRCIAFAY